MERIATLTALVVLDEFVEVLNFGSLLCHFFQVLALRRTVVLEDVECTADVTGFGVVGAFPVDNDIPLSEG